jgi:hypothetical protein
LIPFHTRLAPTATTSLLHFNYVQRRELGNVIDVVVWLGSRQNDNGNDGSRQHGMTTPHVFALNRRHDTIQGRLRRTYPPTQSVVPDTIATKAHVPRCSTSPSRSAAHSGIQPPAALHNASSPSSSSSSSLGSVVVSVVVGVGAVVVVIVVVFVVMFVVVAVVVVCRR